MAKTRSPTLPRRVSLEVVPSSITWTGRAAGDRRRQRSKNPKNRLLVTRTRPSTSGAAASDATVASRRGLPPTRSSVLG